MPELPEVEIMRRLFDEAALGQEIEAVEVVDPTVFKKDPVDLAMSLSGSRFTQTVRIGKHLFCKVDNGRWLLVHFGLTGDLKLLPKEEGAPRFTRIRFLFSTHQLAYTDPRKFGKLEWTESPEQYARHSKLGQDMLSTSLEHFASSLKGRKTMVKPALLEQKFFAGIGNWIADEMLFRCGVHPEERLNRLDEKQLSSLYESGVDIIRFAIRADTHYGDFPEGMFANHRKEKADCPNGHEKSVIRLIVGGRGTFICPICQAKN